MNCPTWKLANGSCRLALVDKIVKQTFSFAAISESERKMTLPEQKGFQQKYCIRDATRNFDS